MDEIAAARTRSASLRKHIFVEFALPLFAASFAGYPLDFAAAGQVSLRSGPANAVDVKGPDGSTWRLFLDASSNLPVSMTWMAKPVVLSVGPPLTDPTAGLPLVEWRLAIGDYRFENGLNWPHHLTTTFAGKTYQRVRLSKFKINPTIDPNKFKPSK